MANSGGLNVTQTLRSGWQVLFGTSGSQYDFGGFDSGVDCDLKLVIDPIIIPSVSKLPLGGRIIGVDPSSKIVLPIKQIALATFQAAMPWYSSGAIPMTPATSGTDEYTYSNLLTLHPIALGSTVTEDINLLHMVPRFPNAKHTGDKDSEIALEFGGFYPDRSQLPLLVYGYIGAVPS